MTHRWVRFALMLAMIATIFGCNNDEEVIDKHERALQAEEEGPRR